MLNERTRLGQPFSSTNHVSLLLEALGLTSGAAGLESTVRKVYRRVTREGASPSDE